MAKPDMIIILSDARGVYIPRDFASSVRRDCTTGVSDEDWAILAAGPDHDEYWDAWQEVEQNARITDPDNGTVYFVYNDSDCWLVPVGMEWSDEEDTFVWPEDDA